MSLRHLDYVPQFSNHNGESLLWKDFLDGDKKALSHIYTRNFDKLYNYGMKISQNASLVEDAIQDLFIELLNRRDRLNPEVKNIKYYLYKCLRRSILSKLTADRKNLNVEEFSSFEIELCHKSHFLNTQMNVEVRQRLMKIIKTLTPKQKEALFLIYFDELSYQEVASIMALKVKTVYNLVHKALSSLKERKKEFWRLSIFAITLFVMNFFS